MKSHKTKVTIFEQMQLLDSQENKDNLKTNEKKKNKCPGYKQQTSL